jgi:hypothetical protein
MINKYLTYVMKLILNHFFIHKLILNHKCQSKILFLLHNNYIKQDIVGIDILKKNINVSPHIRQRR